MVLNCDYGELEIQIEQIARLRLGVDQTSGQRHLCYVISNRRTSLAISRYPRIVSSG
jgi:hypothetical protein